MTSVSILHRLITSFVSFMEKPFKEGSAEVHIRIFMPGDTFNKLMEDFVATCEEANRPNWFVNADSEFEATYFMNNIQVDIHEGADFKLENCLGTQEMEKALADGGPVIPGREPVGVDEDGPKAVLLN